MFSRFDYTEWNSCRSMRVVKRRLHAILLVFSAVPLWQICALSMEEICSHWPGSGHIGDSRDCRGWGYCKNNKLSTRGLCADNLFYDSPSGTCQKAHLVQCAPQRWELCAQRHDREYAADPLNCSTYIKCDEDGENDEQNSCAEGYMFSNKLQTCVSGASGCPQETISICAYMQNGTTVGDPLNCGLYLECQNGKGVRHACTAARYYNDKTGRCQTTMPKYCPTGDSHYQASKCPPPVMDFRVCPSFYQDSQSGVQLISDSQTCHGYYECSSKNGMGKWHSCPYGKHFQWWSQRCVPPESYSCPYDRCSTRNASLVSAINTDCTEYIHCANQMSQRLSACPDMYPYFDERRGICSKDFPNNLVCYMEG